MSRSRLLILALVALAIGGLIAINVYRTLQNRSAAANRPAQDVVVAARDIPVGSRIEDSDLQVVRYPSDSLPSDIFSTKNKIVGRGAVIAIRKGDFILGSKLAAERAGSGLPAMIPPGMRAVSVRVNEVVAVAGFVAPGTRVDVLLTGSPSGGSDQMTTTVLENVLVLAAGQKLERSSGGEAQTVPVITLLVSPDDAQKLTLAQQEGRIQLALRNPLDGNQENLNSVHNSTLYRGTPAPSSGKPVVRTKFTKPTAPPPPSAYTVEIIRGTKTEQNKFEEK